MADYACVLGDYPVRILDGHSHHWKSGSTGIGSSLANQGVVVVATDHIPEGTEILTVPCAALRTRETVPSSIAKNLPKDMTAHGLIAADSALNQSQNTANYAPWEAVVPSWEDIQTSMPLTWPKSLQNLLPAAARQLLDKQRKNFEKDWASVSAAFPFPTKNEIKPSCTRDEYLYAWLLVNTRCFYYTTPQTEKLPKEDHVREPPPPKRLRPSRNSAPILTTE